MSLTAGACLLSQAARDWPGLTVKRVRDSTSKVDNLNVAISLIQTDLVLLNDTDTIVPVDSMIRANGWIFGPKKIDIVQGVNIHSHDDAHGMPDGKGGAFSLLTMVITIEDARLLPEKQLQNYMQKCPFNGRGGFWHADSLRAVGMDHRTVAEDHDSAYRGMTYYGMKGIQDVNIVCQERQPPTREALLKQRIRWETGSMELRRNAHFLMTSRHIGWNEVRASQTAAGQTAHSAAARTSPPHARVAPSDLCRACHSRGCSPRLAHE